MAQVRIRKTNMELLRCLSMVMVVAIHLFTKTSVLWEVSVDSPAYYASWILYGLCMTSVNCFVLITGYFMVNAEFKCEKLLRIYAQVLFYSIAIALIVKYVLHLELSTGWLKAVLPITRREYWFATVYLGLYILSPFMNILIRNLDRRIFMRLLLILGVLFSVIPQFLYANNWLEDGGAYGIVWFIFLYLIGAYIRKYHDIIADRKYGWYYLVAIAVIPISKFAIMLVGNRLHILEPEKVLKVSEVFYQFNAVPALLASVFLFLCFARMKESFGKTDRVIAWGGSLSFGVYLIHDNPNLSHFLWEKLKISYWLAENGNVMIVLLLLLAVYIVCSLIEWLRQQLFKCFRIDRLIDIVAERIKYTVNKYFSVIFLFEVDNDE